MDMLRSNPILRLRALPPLLAIAALVMMRLGRFWIRLGDRPILPLLAESEAYEPESDPMD